MADPDITNVSMVLETEEQIRTHAIEIAARTMQGRSGGPADPAAALIELASAVYIFIKQGPEIAPPPQ
jgi:hypothetical protein